MTLLRDRRQDSLLVHLDEKVTPEVHQMRWNTCLGCENLIRVSSTCKVCGCYMKYKTWIPEEKCDIEKWGTAPADPNYIKK